MIDKAHAVKLFRSGKTQQEIGDLYGVTRARIQQVISLYDLGRKDGGEAKRVATRDKTLRPILRALLRNGRTLPEVNRALGVELKITTDLDRRALLASRAFRRWKYFWSRVEIGAIDDCWPWIGKCWPNGYGQTGSHKYAHRRAFVVAGGKLVRGMCIMHTCDNPPCCNPRHLRQATYSENTRDSVAKGRWRKARVLTPQEREQKRVTFNKHQMERYYSHVSEHGYGPGARAKEVWLRRQAKKGVQQ